MSRDPENNSMKKKTPKTQAQRPIRVVGSGRMVSRVWIVEMWNWDKRIWEPCAEAQLSRAGANRVIRQYWLPNYPDDAFRAVKYIPANTKV